MITRRRLRLRWPGHERRRHEAMLMESEARLQEALTAGGVAAFDWEVVSDKSRRGKNGMA